MRSFRPAGRRGGTSQTGLASSEASRISTHFAAGRGGSGSAPCRGGTGSRRRKRAAAGAQGAVSHLLGDRMQAARSSQLVSGCRARLWLCPQPRGSPGAGWCQRQGPLPSPRLPGSLLTSHVSCFLEMLVQLRSRLTGCRLMMPLSAWGVIDLHLLRSIFVHNLLSQHLGMGTRLKVEPREPHVG